MLQKLTYDSVKSFIESPEGNGCKLLSKEYIQSKKLLQIQCKCGNVFQVSFNTFKHNNQRQCPTCGRKPVYDNAKFNFDNVKKYIECDSNSGCILISQEYINAKTRITIQCKCGNQFTATITNFKRGKRQCNDCGKVIARDKRMQSTGYSNRKRSTEKFKQQVLDIIGNEYEILGEYINIKEPIEIRHNVCGKTYLKSPDRFLLGGKRCPYCSGRMKKTTEQFKQDIIEAVDEEYSLLGKYKNNRTKVLIKHNLCNTEYKVTPHNFLRGRRCPICNESKGEQLIRKYLTTNSIIFIPEFEIAQCKDKNPLPFDFAIFDTKKNLKCLIEYDGEFHYAPILGKEHLDYQNSHDEIKNKYCREQQILLFRIPYWEKDNIEQILRTEILPKALSAERAPQIPRGGTATNKAKAIVIAGKTV